MTVKLHGVRMFGGEGKKYNVKLEIFSQTIENKFHAQKNTRDIAGFDVMLPRPIRVQANVIVHLKVTMRGIAGCDTGWQPKKNAETNGIIVNL